jgi:hypothetical protein
MVTAAVTNRNIEDKMGTLLYIVFIFVSAHSLVQEVGKFRVCKSQSLLKKSIQRQSFVVFSSGNEENGYDNMDKMKVADPQQPIQGYFNTDLNTMDDTKMSRVVAYIFIALLPCLLLVPFYMSRNFTPADF